MQGVDLEKSPLLSGISDWIAGCSGWFRLSFLR